MKRSNKPNQRNKLQSELFNLVLSKLNDESAGKVIITNWELYNIYEKHLLGVQDVIDKLIWMDPFVVIVDDTRKYIHIFDTIVQRVDYLEINFNSQFVQAHFELKKVSSAKMAKKGNTQIIKN